MSPSVPAPGADWRPTASWDGLRRRAEILTQIRSFFTTRGVLEVETPSLAGATVTDLHLASLRLQLRTEGERRAFFLQTSPEFAMKRLLAAGSGPIFQICKSFRDDESGRRHNPEFTMLEWYRPGFDHHRLMDEMDELLSMILGCGAAERLSYAEGFARHLGLDAHAASVAELAAAAATHGIDLSIEAAADLGRDDWLSLLLTHVVEPALGRDAPTFLYDYPASQAALARIRPGAPPVAERFEVYWRGVELANGFHELSDADEQRRRFEADLEARRRAALPTPPIDERLLAALAHGLPDCAGVALGVDRLVMAALGSDDIESVLAFPISRA